MAHSHFLHFSSQKLTLSKRFSSPTFFFTLCMQTLVTMLNVSPKDLSWSKIIVHLMFYLIFVYLVPQICDLLEAETSFVYWIFSALGPS